MPMKIRIEHDGKGWMEVWKSDGMQSVVNQAGERIAKEANGGHSVEAFRYYPKPGSFTAMGFVSSTGPTGAVYQQQNKSLSRAVHR